MFLGLALNGWIMLGIIIFIIYAQLATKMTTDAVYLTAILALVLTGIMDSGEVFQGLVTPATLFLIFMFVIVECMQRTGALKWTMDHILGKYKNMNSTLLRLTLTATSLSAFISNPSVGQIMYNSASEWGRRFHLPPSKLLLPIAYMIGIGGTCTVIAYPVNLLLISLLEHATGEHYNILVTLPGGAFCSVICIISIFLFQRRLPVCKDPEAALAATEDYMVEMLVPTTNSLVGSTIEEAGLNKLDCGHIVRIVHFDHEVITPVSNDDIILGGDRLVFTGDITELVKLRDKLEFVSSTHHVYNINELNIRHNQYSKISLTNKSPLVGKSISETDFEETNHVVLVALLRAGERIDKLPREIILKTGDTLLFEGEKIQLPTTSEQYIIHEAPQMGKLSWRGGISIVALALVIILSAVNVMPLLDAAFCAALCLCALGCCTRAQAWSSIVWNFVVMLTGAFAIGIAMKSSGLAGALSDIIGIFCGTSPMQTTITLTIAAVLMTQVLFDATVVPVLVPIALESAAQMGISPLPLVMAILLGSACNFTTPISTAHMVMVYPVGGYRVRDLVNFGWPFCIIMTVAIVIAVQLFYPY